MKVSRQTVWADDDGTQLVMFDPSADEQYRIRIYPDWTNAATAKNLISALKEVLPMLDQDESDQLSIANNRYDEAVEDLTSE